AAFDYSLQYGVVFAIVLAVATRATGRRAVGVAAAFLVTTLWTLGGSWEGGDVFVQSLLPAAVITVLFLRSGLLPVAAMMFATLLTKWFPLELPGLSWYGNAPWLPLAALLGLAAWSLVAMFAGRPMFKVPTPPLG